MKTLKILLVIVILISLFFFVRATDMEQVMISMRQVGYRFLILILVTFAAAFLATIGWRYCMGEPGKKLSLWELFLIRVVGEGVGLINPTSVVGGEAVKVFLLREKEIEQKTVVASALISRTLMVLTQLLLLLIAGFVLVYRGGFSLRLPALSPTFYLLSLVVLVLLFLLFRTSWLRKLLLSSALGKPLAHRTAVLLQRLRELRADLSLFYKNNKRDLALASLFFAVHWVLGGMEFYCILYFLGIKASLAQSILVDMGVVFFKAAGAFIPGQIGIEEYGNKVMLATIGVVGGGTWIAVSILRRARQLFWVTFGLIVYLAMYKRWGDALRRS